MFAHIFSLGTNFELKTKFVTRRPYPGFCFTHRDALYFKPKMSLFQKIKQNQSSLALRALSHDFFLFLPQIAKAYIKLMGTLTRLLGGVEHQDPYSLIDEIRAILLLEVKVVKVHKEIK